MDLYLVRHAIAEPRDAGRWPEDARRPLSPDGIERFRPAARGLRKLGGGIDAVLTSSYLRAFQTAMVLTEEAHWPRAEVCQAIEPPAAAADALEMLERRAESSLALVGHQPELAELASLLLTESKHAVELELKKGGAVCLHFSGRPGPGRGVLRWSVSPKILRQLGR